MLKILFRGGSVTTTRNIRKVSHDAKTVYDHLLLQFDGGSRGNPGLGGSGSVLFVKEPTGEKKELWSKASFIGATGITNNLAEYYGLIEGLKQAVQLRVRSLEIEGDSQLVINQLRGDYKIKSKNLISIYEKAMELLKEIPNAVFSHIPRSQNKRADELSNIAMDHMATRAVTKRIVPSSTDTKEFDKYMTGISSHVEDVLEKEEQSAASKHFLLRFDGGSRGNPGLGGAGSVLYVKSPDGSTAKELWSKSSFLGSSGVTSNVAEYCGLIEGLKQAVQMSAQSLEVQGDSELVINQLRGVYKVRHKTLQSLHLTAKSLLDQIPAVALSHIPRASNQRADSLSNIAMDMKRSHFTVMENNTTLQEREEASSALLIPTEQPDLIRLPEGSLPIQQENNNDNNNNNNNLIHNTKHKLILILMVSEGEHPTLVVVSERLRTAYNSSSNSPPLSAESSSLAALNFLSHEIDIPASQDSSLPHEAIVLSAVQDFLAQNKMKGKILKKHTFWDSHGSGLSSINYCVIELPNIKNHAVKKIETLNRKLEKLFEPISTTTTTTTTTAKRRRPRKHRKVIPANNILGMGVRRLRSVPVDSLTAYLEEENQLRNKPVDPFLISWALGYQNSQHCRNNGL